MALAVGDIIQFTDEQLYLGQQVLNVYHYRVDELDPDVTIGDLADQFVTLILSIIREIQITSLIHTQVTVRNLTNGLDIWEEPLDLAGLADVPDPMPSFVTYAYRLIRSTALTRHGAKRIAGVGEGWVNGNVPTPTALPGLQSRASVFVDPVSREGTVSDFVLTPVIVGRVPTGELGAGEYDLSRINPVADAQFIRISTQTTRRAGRGS